MSLRVCVPLLSAVLALACASPTPPAPTASPATLRHLPAGDLMGHLAANGVHVYRGVPFATPPLGPLRWRAPEPLPAWSGTREALSPGSMCVQFAPLAADAEPGSVVGDEDCLTLSIYAPPPAANAQANDETGKPVMLWIHGGGNTIGSEEPYDWARFALENDVVVVATNYRLGAFGWFRQPLLWEEGDDALDHSGNFGTLDLIRSLEWVRDNAAALGGDPGNVTIFGESAGGLNVISLLLSPPAAGLFHRAISQSGGTWTATVAQAENWTDAADPGLPGSSNEVLARLLVRLGVAESRETAKATLDVESILRGASVDDLMEAYRLEERGMDEVPLAIRDGAVLPESSFLDAFSEGRYNQVPTILGTNRDESRLFLMMNPEYTRNLFGVLPRIRDAARYERDARYGSDFWKADGADEIAIAMRRHQASVWVYRFDWDEEPSRFGSDFSQLLGAGHAVEIPFVLGTPLGFFERIMASDENAPGREELSAKMRSYWGAMARRGDPGRGRDGALPAWTAWDSSTPESPRFIVLDTEADAGVHMSSDFLTTERLVARMLADPRFTPEERCEGLVEVVEGSDQFGPELYASAGCGELSIASEEESSEATQPAR